MEELKVISNALDSAFSVLGGIYAKMPPLQQYFVWVAFSLIISVWLLRKSRRYIARTYISLVSEENRQPYPNLPAMTIYAGFWRRVSAVILDLFFYYLVVIMPLLYIVRGGIVPRNTGSDHYLYGWVGFVIEGIAPIIIWFAFLIWKQATPGKLLIKTYIADEKTGGKPTLLQLFVLYIGYFVSCIPLGLGLFWAGWNKKKQGWHNLLSRTVVLQRIDHPGASK